MNKSELFNKCKNYMLDRNDIGYYDDESKCLELWKEIKEICKDNENSKIFVISVLNTFYEMEEEYRYKEYNESEYIYNKKEMINYLVNYWDLSWDESVENINEDLNKFKEDLFGFELMG